MQKGNIREARRAKLMRDAIENAQKDGRTIVYAGLIDECPEDIWMQWEKAAQAKAAQEYGLANAALAAQIYI